MDFLLVTCEGNKFEKLPSLLIHMSTKKLLVFTGAGVSAESGIKTFRDSGGLWEEYNIAEVATPEAWKRDYRKVLDFYNKRRKQVVEAKPNKAHKIIAELENYFDVEVVTQNIDDLHERAGSSKVLHLHGEIMKSRSTADENLIYPITGIDINPGDKCEKGSQLRPHIVWFGELVPAMEDAYKLAAKADLFVIIGTSLNVYPAAGLVHFAPKNSTKFLVDPQDCPVDGIENLTVIKDTAVNGMQKVKEILLASK
jgi:NAD-dependent deacetylase